MELQTCINKIVGEFGKGLYFDSHSVINELLTNKEYHRSYLENYSDNLTVGEYHGQIAQMIGKVSGVEKIDGKILTHTIYSELSPNALWRKEE